MYPRTLLILLVLLFAAPNLARAEIVQTTDPAVAAAFMAGAQIETFDDLAAFPLTTYAAGQTLDPDARFNSRNGLIEPTFNSGGGSFNDPVGNPGTPIGIFAPTGGIASDVVSPPNVAGPLVVTDPTQPFNDGFLEVFFVDEVARVGFWVTHGSLTLTVLDSDGLSFDSGDHTLTASAGEFVGIDRGAAEIKIATMIPATGFDAFTVDDVVWSTATQAPPPNRRLAYVGNTTDWPFIADFDAPENMVASPDGRHVYVFAGASESLAVFERDASTGRLGYSTSYFEGQSGFEGLRFGVLAAAVSADGTNLYYSENDSVTVLGRDAETGELTFLQRFTDGVGGVTGLGGTFGLTESPDGRHVYVAGHTSQTVVTFSRDLVTGLLTFQSSTSEGIAEFATLPDGLCMSPDGRSLYLATFFDHLTVYDRDPQNGALSLVEVELFDAPTGSCVVSPDGRFLYTRGEPAVGANRPIGIASRDPATGALTRIGASEALPFYPSTLALGPAGDSLYVAGSSRMVVLDRDRDDGTLSVVQHIEDDVEGVEGIDSGFVYGPLVVASGDGRHVYMLGESDDAIAAFSTSVFRPADLAIGGETIPADALGAPFRVVVSPDSRFAYVTGTATDSVASFEIDRETLRLVYLERKRAGEIEDVSGATIQGLDGATGIAIAPDGSQVYVVGGVDGGGWVVWLDRESDGTLTYLDDYFDPRLEGGGEVAVSMDGTRVFATNRENDAWLTFDRAPDGSLALSPLLPASPVVGAGALALTDDVAFVAFDDPGSSTSGVEAFVRDGSGQYVFEDRFGCDPLHSFDVVVAHDEAHVYVSCEASGAARLHGIAWDPTTGTLSSAGFVQDDPAGAINGLAGIDGVAISADDRWVAAAGEGADAISIFARDAVSGELYLAQKEFDAVEANAIGTSSAVDVAFSPDGDFLLVAGGGEVDGTLALFVPEPSVLPGLCAGVAFVFGLARRAERRRGGSPTAPADVPGRGRWIRRDGRMPEEVHP